MAQCRHPLTMTRKAFGSTAPLSPVRAMVARATACSFMSFATRMCSFRTPSAVFSCFFASISDFHEDQQAACTARDESPAQNFKVSWTFSFFSASLSDSIFLDLTAARQAVKTVWASDSRDDMARPPMARNKPGCNDSLPFFMASWNFLTCRASFCKRCHAWKGSFISICSPPAGAQRAMAVIKASFRPAAMRSEPAACFVKCSSCSSLSRT
mmetsp:Transcript_58867/g.105760  ORF Transcript_58867/g.105760 Transcript_58867/m.105760 type:complete len:212 (-) Transcript_58867:494-1129(-)